MRNSFAESYTKEVSLKVSKVKSEKNSQQSIQKMKQNAYEEARKVRQASARNELIIKNKQKN